MNLLLDQDVYALTARFLIDCGYDVITASQAMLSRASDEQILKFAGLQKRILITRDSDFGHLVFVRSTGTGVIYLRMMPETIMQVHEELRRVLQHYSQDALQNAFVVVSPNGHRYRKIRQN